MGDGTQAQEAPGHGMADLGLQHVGHPVGHGPHALADLRLALETAGQADIDILVFIGRQPFAGLHLALAHHGAGIHGGVHLIAGAVQEAGIDEDDAVLGGADAFLQVGARCGAPRPSRPS